jgi:hypothetical protein
MSRKIADKCDIEMGKRKSSEIELGQVDAATMEPSS